MDKLQIHATSIEGLQVIERRPIVDNRGFLARIFCLDELKNAGWQKTISQINQTMTKCKGTVRGMHFQNSPHEEMKLITCLRGEIWDVAVDIRKNSPTFLKWHAEKLSENNCRAILIPEGFAHGFQALTDNCELLYLHSAPYVGKSEGGIRPTDPMINVAWPLKISEISKRDSEHDLLNCKFMGI